MLIDVLSRPGRAEHGTFDDGIELALRRLLVSPEFLYRIEAAIRRATVAPLATCGELRRRAVRSDVRRLTTHELASRLSFFLWSSIPDDELLDAGRRGTLRDARRCSTRRCGACSPTRASETLTHELRGAVAADPQPGDGAARRELRARLRRDAAAEHAARDRAVLRQHRAREPRRRSSCSRPTTRS